MTRSVVRTRRIGGSIVVRIPKDVTQKEDIREDEFVEIDVKKAREDWFGTFPSLKRFSREEELDAHN